jgi:hypothetical protein
MNADHHRKYNEVLTKAKTAYTFAKTPSFTTMIRSSAQWVDAHVPAHDTGEIVTNGLESTTRALYSYGSSFIHGYKWMTDYAPDGTVSASRGRRGRTRHRADRRRGSVWSGPP